MISQVLINSFVAVAALLIQEGGGLLQRTTSVLRCLPKSKWMPKANVHFSNIIIPTDLLMTNYAPCSTSCDV